LITPNVNTLSCFSNTRNGLLPKREFKNDEWSLQESIPLQNQETYLVDHPRVAINRSVGIGGVDYLKSSARASASEYSPIMIVDSLESAEV
jgi:hypothetical protein